MESLLCLQAEAVQTVIHHSKEMNAGWLQKQHKQRLNILAESCIARLLCMFRSAARRRLPTACQVLAKDVPSLLVEALAQPDHWGSCRLRKEVYVVTVTRIQPLLPRPSDSCSFYSAHCSICNGNTRSVTRRPLLIHACRTGASDRALIVTSLIAGSYAVS